MKYSLTFKKKTTDFKFCITILKNLWVLEPYLQRDDVGVRQMDQASKDLVRLQSLLPSPPHFWFQPPSCKDATIPIGSSHPTNPPQQKRGGIEATPWFRRMLPWDMPAYHYHVVSPIQVHPRDSECFFILQSTNPKTEPSSSPKY